MDGSGWNVMGRGRPLRPPRGRGAGFFGGYGNRTKQPAKQPVKRQRVSTDSTGSATGASKSDIPLPKLTVDQFKSLNVDGKLENIFLCLQGIMSRHERLLKAEQFSKCVKRAKSIKVVSIYWHINPLTMNHVKGEITLFSMGSLKT